MLTISTALQNRLETLIANQIAVTWCWSSGEGYLRYYETQTPILPPLPAFWEHINRPGGLQQFYSLTDVQTATTISLGSGDGVWVASWTLPPNIPCL